MDGRAKSERPHLGVALSGLTHYEITLQGFLKRARMALPIACASGLVMALIGPPLLALGWTAVSLVADWFLGRRYRQLESVAAATSDRQGLFRLAIYGFLRAWLWMAPGLYLTLIQPTPSHVTYLALTGLTLAALAAALGWASRMVWFAIGMPPALAVFIAGAVQIGFGWELLGTALALAGFMALANTMARTTFATLQGWSRAERRSLEAMAEVQASERELTIARDRAEAANRAKSEFLANMSHEIRTPLNGVLGMADLLARSKLSKRDREMVETVRASANTLSGLLTDILDLARIEAGEVRIETEPFHLGDKIRTIAALLRLKAEEKGVALEVEIAPEADRAFAGDPLRVRQVITNLVSNAVKFTDQGSVRILASCADGRVRVEVRDTGVGFDEAARDQVFGRFQQADGSITRRFGGSGLGLAISRQLAELMDGVLDCESRPGEGSCFWFELPLAPADPPAEPAAAGPTQLGSEPLRILVADDHPTNRKVAQMILEEAGAVVTVAEDGREALMLFAAEAFDVVLMDMQMPVMDGLAAIAAIRDLEQAEGRRRTPVLMLTANAMAEHVAAGDAAGADGHIAKPITAADLLGGISAVLADDDVSRRQGTP